MNNMRPFLYSSVLLFLLAIPTTSFAASLSIFPSSGSYTVGDTVTLKVVVSSPNESINAVSGSLLFSSSVFSVRSISKMDSVLNFWPSDPSTSQSSASFGGVSLSGFQGSAGTVVVITLRAIRTGTGTASFQSGQVLANDGKGTDVTAGLSGASYTVNPASNSPSPTVLKSSGEKVIIASSTRPDSTSPQVLPILTGLALVLLGWLVGRRSSPHVHTTAMEKHARTRK